MSCMTYMQYRLYTIMVFDEWQNESLVAWFITSSSKEEDVTYVLATLKDKMVAAMATCTTTISAINDYVYDPKTNRK